MSTIGASTSTLPVSAPVGPADTPADAGGHENAQQAGADASQPQTHAKLPKPLSKNQAAADTSGQPDQAGVIAKNAQSGRSAQASEAGAAQIQSAQSTKTATTGHVHTDTIAKGEKAGISEADDAKKGSLSTPELPASESVFGKGEQENLKSFVSQLKFGTDLIKAPGTWTDIKMRALELQKSPEQSFLLTSIASPATGKMIDEVGAGISAQGDAIRAALSPEMQKQYDLIVSTVVNSPLGQMVKANGGPVTLAMLAEAAADAIICACTQMNNLDGQKNKDLIGQFIKQTQSKDASNRNLMSQMMGATNEKLEASAIQKASADKQKFWNCIIAVAMIVVAVVMAVLSVFTCGGTGALAVLAVMAAVAAITMAVITVITQLPAILDEMGVDVSGYRAALGGPLGKVLLVLQIVCAVIALAYGAASIVTALSAAGTAAAGAAQAGASGASAGAGAGASTADGVASTADGVASTGTGVASTGGSVASTGTGVASTGGSVASTGADVSGAAAQTAKASAETAKSTATAITVTKTGLGVAQAAIQMGRTMINHTQAQIDKNLAELDQDVQDLAAKMAKVKADMEGDQVQQKGLQDDMKDAMDQMQQIMGKMFAAMETQSQTSATVGHLLSPGH